MFLCRLPDIPCGVLIVPSGIETNSNKNESKHERVLIVPSGIETCFF